MLAKFANERAGAVAIVISIVAPVIIAFTAFAVDLGSIYLQSRQLQGVADLAALQAAMDPARPVEAAQATVAQNSLHGPVRLDVTLGAYSADPNVPANRRFTAGATPSNAVQVRVCAQASLFFGAAILGHDTINISRVATAAQTRLVAFSLGSRLLAVNGGAANALLSGLTGSQVSLSVMDYQALATADVDLLEYTRALAIHEHLVGASFDQVLAHHTTGPEALGVLADVLAADHHVSEAAAMRRLAGSAGSAPDPVLSQLLDLGPYGNQDHVSGASSATVRVSALDFANAILLLSQQGRQVQLDLGAGVPGLVSTRVWLAIGERPNQSPWLTVGHDGSVTLRTAQMRLYADTQVGGGPAAGLGVAQVRLPVLLQLAEARAQVTDIDCAGASVGVRVAPGVGRLLIGDIDLRQLNNFQSELATTPARIVSLPMISATAAADLHIGGDEWQAVRFAESDVAAGTVRTVSTRDIAQASVASLLGRTSIGVTVGGQSLGLVGSGLTQGLTSALATALGTAAAPLDGLLNGLTDLLGVHLGQADVRLNGMRCNDAALVA